MNKKGTYSIKFKTGASVISLCDLVTAQIRISSKFRVPITGRGQWEEILIFVTMWGISNYFRGAPALFWSYCLLEEPVGTFTFRRNLF